MSLESLTIRYCDELEHIVVDIRDGSGGNKLGINVLPKLKELHVQYCGELKYIFGHINASDDHDQNNNEIQLHLPALESLKLVELQSLISMCPKQYHTTFPPLKELELNECSQFDVKSIGDFTFHTSVSRYQDSTTIKQFNGNMDHFLALERLMVSESNAESILCLNAESERNIDLGLQSIDLKNLPMMISLFAAPKNAFALKNLKSLTIKQCEKLEIVFSTSVLRCLSQLSHLKIEECNELKHIIEDDDIENSMSSKTCCFSVLETLAVVKCNKLKSVFPISMRKVLPELKVMLIWDADELEEIFKSVGDDDQKIEIPNLEAVGFANLSCLCHVQGIQFQAVKVHLVHNCKKLSPVTSLTSEGIDLFYDIYGIDYSVRREVYHLFKKLMDEIEVQVEAEPILTSSQKEKNRILEAEHEFNENVPDLEIPSVATLPTNSQELISEQSTSQQHSLGQIDTTIQLSQGDYVIHKINFTSTRVEVYYNLKYPFNMKQGININVEEGTTSTNANTIASSGHELTFSHDNDIDSNIPGLETKMKQTSKGKQEFFVNVPRLVEIPSIANSDGIELSFHDFDLGETKETTRTNNQDFGLYLKMESAYRQFQESKYHDDVNENPNAQTSKGFAEWIEVQTTLGHKLTSSQKKMKKAPEAKHKFVDDVPDLKIPSIVLLPTNSEEDGDEKICIPSFSIVNTKLVAIKDVDIGDSQETIAVEDINKLIEEDPLFALEKLLTGVQSFSIGTLLQELKTLMDSSSDIDHLVSNQESKLKLISLFDGLNQHQRLLPSDVKEFVEKVQNFFNDNIIKHDTAQQVLKKHNQLLDLKTDLMNKFSSAKSTQIHIDSETATANAKIHELSLQIEDLENQRGVLKSVVNKCDVQKMKLKAECTELAQQSKKFISALASSEVDVREVERARNLAKEGFENLKSSFPTF
ncbi:hypothetical protein P8452_19625 [Trifolium repens]|nr:hypothetical protein P8452_19625 [Trifolium repens]